LRVANLEDKAQRGERADAGDLLEALGDGIIFFTALHQVAFHPFDLFAHLGEHGEQWLHDRQTIGGHVSQNRFVKRFTRRIAQGMAEALEGEADGVDEIDAGANQGVAQLEAEQVVLGLGGAVLDGMKQGWINPRQTRQHLRVAAVALAFVTGDGVELARVGDQHGGAAPGEEAADPRAVHAGFQRDGGTGKLDEQLGQRRPGVGQ
jgi:hypothetical protein